MYAHVFVCVRACAFQVYVTRSIIGKRNLDTAHKTKSTNQNRHASDTVQYYSQVCHICLYIQYFTKYTCNMKRNKMIQPKASWLMWIFQHFKLHNILTAVGNELSEPRVNIFLVLLHELKRDLASTKTVWNLFSVYFKQLNRNTLLDFWIGTD